MDSIILKLPNIALYYYVSKDFNFRQVPNLENYGYRLTVGQKLKCIRYHDSNAEMFVNPVIKEITEDGLYITHLMGGGENHEEIVFVPFRKSLPNNHIYEMRDMYIEPCEHLYEKNNMEDILSGNIQKSHIYCQVEREGIWYWHGGCRSKNKESDENLQNFVRMGQMTFTELNREVGISDRYDAIFKG